MICNLNPAECDTTGLLDSSCQEQYQYLRKRHIHPQKEERQKETSVTHVVCCQPAIQQYLNAQHGALHIQSISRSNRIGLVRKSALVGIMEELLSLLDHCSHLVQSRN